MSLVVNIVADSKFPIDRKRLRKALIKAWDDYGVGSEAELSIAVVGTRKMAKLHESYLGKEGPTDVLAFAQQEMAGDEHGFVSPSEVSLELGDIVICYPLALEQAVEQNVVVDDRVGALALHGFKNLIGKGEK